jgi:hypothetical protein
LPIESKNPNEEQRDALSAETEYPLTVCVGFHGHSELTGKRLLF